MASGEKKHEDSPGDAKNAYSEYLRQQSEGPHVDFDHFCAQHPTLEGSLRSIHECVQLGQSLATSRSFHQSICERFGDVEEVTISLGMDSPLLSGDSGENRDRTSAPTKTGHRYEPEGEVGRGGMGVIYRVTDRDLNRTIAMKVMLAPHEKEGEAWEKADSQFLARFLEEAQVTAQLDHPGIVPVYELAFDSEGHVYFTMKLVKGRELGEIFELVGEERDGWNLSRAVGALVKACQAVAFAHAKGVIHRDLKPSNVMVGRFGEIYVMDWGLAKVVGKKDLHDIRLKPDSQITHTSVHSERRAAIERSVESPLITMDGSVVGTPAYMPPEQAEGRVDEVDQRSDVYSLGAILYCLLTGQAPYVSRGTRMSPRTILARVIEGPPKRVHKLNPRAPAELVAICEKAMTRAAGKRYTSSLELSEDLEAFLDQRVVQAYEVGAVAEFKKWVVRNKALAASLGAALLFALVGLVAVTFVEARAKRVLTVANTIIQEERDEAVKAKEYAEQAQNVAEERRVEAQNSAERATKATLFIASILSKKRDLNLLRRAERLAASELAAPLDRAAVFEAIARSYDAIAESYKDVRQVKELVRSALEAEERLIRQCLEIREKELGKSHEDTIRILEFLDVCLAKREN